MKMVFVILKKDFFGRSALEVAPDLLGKVLVRRYRGREIVGIIMETEAYDGPHDLASHASKGETPRNKVMFGEAGRFYVYLCYGMHWMLNIVTGEKGYPAAVLIRGVRVFGDNDKKDVYLDGPGKVTNFFKIDRKLNGRVVGFESGFWIEDRGIVVPKNSIKRKPRIGVQYAGVWARRLYRFLLSAKKA